MIDIIILVVACVILLGLVYLSELVKDWIWGRVFALFRFLFKSLVIGLVVMSLVGALLGQVIKVLYYQGPVFPTWFQVMLYILVGVTGVSLFVSGYRRLTGSNSGEELSRVVPDPGPEMEYEEEDPSVFPWKRCVLMMGGMMILINISLMGVCYALGVSTADWSLWDIGLILLGSAFISGVSWLIYEIRRERRYVRLKQERAEAAARARLEEDRLARLAAAAEAERLEAERLEAEREAERREAARLAEEARRLRSLDPPTDPGLSAPRAPRLIPLAPPELSDPFGSRLIPPSAPGPRDPASGGPAHSPASRAAPPSAPGHSRPMPPPTFGRPTARPAEENDMDTHAPPPPEAPRGRLAAVGDTVKANWPWVVGAMAVLALAGLGFWFWPESGPSEQDLLVERAVQMQAEETLRTYMKTDPVMLKKCPQGLFDDDCRGKLIADKIALPPCVQVEQSQVNTSGVSSWTAMDDQCRAEMVRQNGRRVKEAAARPTGEVRQFLENTEFSQRRAFQTGDTVRINALLEDPALKREVILDFWMQSTVPRRILAHPSLNQGDLTKIYGVIQENGWYEAMPWLMINPNLDPNLRGMWLTRPVANPAEREHLILLGMHQSAVSAGAFSWLVEQALDEYKEGKLELWNILLKAGENGDLRVDKCHLEGEQDKDRKTYPLCEEGQTWDTVGQMEQAQAKDSTLPSPSIGWTELRSRCSFESMVGRHSRAAKASEEKVIRRMADASPANLPLEP